MIDSGSVKQRIEQFDTKNGDDAICIDGWLLFSNGAMRELNPLGALIDPPEDAIKRSRNIVRYRHELVQRAENEFKELKRQLLQQAQLSVQHAAANTPPPPPSNADLEKLKRLQELVQERRRQFADAREQLKNDMPEAMKEREARAVNIRESGMRLITALEGIKI